MDAWLHNELFVGASLFFIRVFVALRLTPLLGGRPLPTVVCLGIASALTPIALPLVLTSLTADISSFNFLLLVMREVLIGASLGLLAMLVFSVLDMIGGMTNLAFLPFADGSSEGDSGKAPLRGLFTFFGIGAFMMIGGHHYLFSAIVGSVRCVPVGGAFVDGRFELLLESAAGLFAGAFAWAVMTAAPAFVAGLFAEIFSGIAVRMIPAFGQVTGGQPLRIILVNLMLIAILAVSVSSVVSFLQSGIESLPICKI